MRSRTKRCSRFSTLVALAALAVLAAGCGGGGSGGGGGGSAGIADALVLVDLDVGGSDGIPINEILRFEFSAPIDPETVRPDTIRIRRGPDYGRQVPGEFRTDGRFVTFLPRLPILPDLSDAGLQPDEDYRVILIGAPDVATVRSVDADRLKKAVKVDFRTADLASADLFRDNFLDPAPPSVIFVNPADGSSDVSAAADLSLIFNRRPLLPATVNTANISLTMVSRRGEPRYRPIPGSLEMRQTHDSIEVLFRPTYPLADEATYELRVDRRVQDLLGNDVVPFSSTFTIRDEDYRDGSLVYEFDSSEKSTELDLDRTTASWDEMVPGALSALFTMAGGNGTAGDLLPTSNLTLRPEDFTRGVTQEVIDGVETDVYNFRTIDIPAGVTVRIARSASGQNRPVRLVALNGIRILGTLNIEGLDGANGDSVASTKAMPPAPGGQAGPGGGDGASAYTGSAHTSVPPQNGEDVDFGGGGGKGGTSGTYSYKGSSYEYGYSYGGGGGGGGSRLPGQGGNDGGYRYNSSFNGKGGQGGLSAGQRGYGENEARQPNVGGAGGGAGGKGFYYYTSSYYTRNYNDTAGAGGGGGGAVTIQSASDLVLGASSRILADGGDGGLSSRSSYYYGGAGGGGGGGSILLRATGDLKVEGASILSVAGGAGGGFGGSYTGYQGGEGGVGGNGYIRVEAREDENSPGRPSIIGLQNASTTYGPVPQGIFAPEGGGAPSVGQTLWRNLGVFEPIMSKPAKSDLVANLLNDTMVIEVQMAVEDENDLGAPDLGALDVADNDGDGDNEDSLDPARLSEWTRLSDIETLNGNGYQFIRVRVTFQLDDTQTADQPLPSLDYLRIPYKF